MILLNSPLPPRGFRDNIPPLQSRVSMQNDAIPFLMFGFFIALVVALIVWGIHYARKRTAEFSQVAQQIGFQFLGDTWRGPSLPPRPNMCLIQRTRGKFSNAMIGSAGGLNVSLFDYTYHVGKNTATYTLAAFSHDLQLPPFELRAENVFDRIGDAFVHSDIDFDSHPEFSRRYLLRSPDEAGARQIFTPSLLTYFEQIPSDKKWHVEASGMALILYRTTGPLRSADIQPFLDETSSIARTIFSSGGARRPS